jgi:hypothetical protein
LTAQLSLPNVRLTLKANGANADTNLHAPPSYIRWAGARVSIGREARDVLFTLRHEEPRVTPHSDDIPRSAGYNEKPPDSIAHFSPNRLSEMPPARLRIHRPIAAAASPSRRASDNSKFVDIDPSRLPQQGQRDPSTLPSPQIQYGGEPQTMRFHEDVDSLLGEV